MAQIITKKMKVSLIGITCMCAVSTAQAAISLDRTRVVFNGEDKSMTLRISNDNKQQPYLAQSWLENEQGVKITTGPLIVTPPVQRLEPSAKSMVRITTTPDINKLPQDKESLFYFNVREIPPKSEKGNVLQIALQTKIKLFYRPKAIQAASNAVWQDQLILNTIDNGYRIENPTPYYIVIAGLGGSKEEAEKGKFTAVMLPPKSTQSVKAGNYSTPWLAYINDHGGRPVIAFQCSGSRCTAKK